MDNKVKSISLIDELILGPVVEELRKMGDFKVLVTPDHPTPLSLKTHTNDPVPFLIYDSTKAGAGTSLGFSEKTAAASGLVIEPGYTMMKKFIEE